MQNNIVDIKKISFEIKELSKKERIIKKDICYYRNCISLQEKRINNINFKEKNIFIKAFKNMFIL